MKSLTSFLKSHFNDVIKRNFNADIDAEVIACADENFGHYQCNSSFKLAKILKKSPMDIAKELVELSNFLLKDKVLEKIEFVKPGFVNIFFSKEFLSQKLNDLFQDKYLKVDVSKKPKKIIVEFSSPNVAKELHVGHLRSTIIGDCIARLFEFLQNDVLRLNHIGDWGTQFGMLIAYIEDKDLDEKVDLSILMKWYKEAKKKFDADENFKKKSQKKVVELQAKEKEAFSIWKKICDISKKGYLEIYDLLDIKIIERGESFYNPVLKSIVKELEEKGLIEISDGAKCIFLEGFKNKEQKPLPLIVQKSDGAFNYVTTDLAAMKQRAQKEKADRIIVVIDIGQSLHMKMVYQASVRANFLDPNKTKFDHVAFGLVLGPDGKKFKTREGKTEKLIDLLNGAILKAKQILIERKFCEDEIDNLAKILGINAIKYSDLSCHRIKDYKFSYDKMLQFEGNTSTFLLYSYVRMVGIERNIKVDIKKIFKEEKIDLHHISEISLGLHLLKFQEVIKAFEKDLLPNRLCDYLYVLAEKFNHFFRDCKVIGSSNQNQRLVLVEAARRVMKKGFDILGLKTVNKM